MLRRVTACEQSPQRFAGMRPALKLHRRMTRLIPFSDALSACQRASGFVICPNFPYAKLCRVAGDA
jgi:hypothetical protein